MLQGRYSEKLGPFKGEGMWKWGFPDGSVLKNSGDNRRHKFNSLGQEDPLEKEMATHSNILARIIPWTEEPGGLQSMGSQRVGHDLVTEQQQMQIWQEKDELSSSLDSEGSSL